MKQSFSKALSLLGPLFGLAAVMIFFQVLAPNRSINMDDIRTISVHTVVTGIAAFGMTFIIISGGIDLSVGSAIALSGVVVALGLEADLPVLVAILIAIATGAVCGLYNALLITILRLPPFIATLGMMGFYRGVAKWIAGNSPVNAPPKGMEEWVNPFPDPEVGFAPFGLAPAVWLLLGLALFMAFLLRYSVLGRHTYALGSNEATARLCGIPVNRVKIQIYMVAGVLTGLAGLLQFARLTQGDPTVAIGLELDVIAAVVIGGGFLSGGQGSILGTLAGAFLMAYLRNRCTALEWPNYFQEMIVGHIIILAVALDQWRTRRQLRN